MNRYRLTLQPRHRSSLVPALLRAAWKLLRPPSDLALVVAAALPIVAPVGRKATSPQGHKEAIQKIGP